MQIKRSIVIFGIGPISKTIFYSCRKQKTFDICSFTADQQYIKEDTFCNLPVIAFEEIESLYPPEQFDMLVVNVGAVAGASSRKDMFLRAQQKGYHLVNYIDPKADVVDDVIMGQNNIIMANTHVGPSGKMGDNNFIRENIYLGHNFDIGSHNFLGPGSTFGGSCHIGDLNFVGMAVTFINNITIEDNNLIGAASLVLKNIGIGGKYIGHPAKKIAEYTKTSQTYE